MTQPEIDPDAAQERQWRVRRQRRSTATIIVVLLALAGAFYYASTYFSETAPTPAACTTEAPVSALTPQDVSVNVYNATTRAGLAAAVAKDARTRGFKVKAVANDPLKKKIGQNAQIRFGPDGLESAKLLLTHVPGAVMLNDKRKGDTIDLVVGNRWKSFGKVPVAATPTQSLRPCPTVTVVG